MILLIDRLQLASLCIQSNVIEYRAPVMADCSFIHVVMHEAKRRTVLYPRDRESHLQSWNSTLDPAVKACLNVASVHIDASICNVVGQTNRSTVKSGELHHW